LKWPQAIILAATDNEEVARRLSLWRGVVPMVCDLQGDMEDVITRVVDGAVKRAKAPENATLVFVNHAGVREYGDRSRSRRFELRADLTGVGARFARVGLAGFAVLSGSSLRDLWGTA
jgi:hypothetical protein